MFEKILGHDVQKEYLKDIIDNENISHSYLFTGSEGIGKASIALEFAKVLLKTDNLNNCPDFKYISRGSDKKDIVIEQIRREIIDDIYIMPAIGDKKVYIIDDSQYLNTAAQNALLKTLEEPPKYVVIILISSNISTFLPTIISRVTVLSFSNLNTKLLTDYIMDNYDISLDENKVEYLDGSLGTAIEMIQNNIFEKLLNIDMLFDSLTKKDIVNCFDIIQTIEFSKAHMLDYLEYLLYKAKCYGCIKHIERAKIRLKYNGNYDIVIDNMILSINDSI